MALLYYCRAHSLWTRPPYGPAERYDDVKYDLMRVSYESRQIGGGLQDGFSAKETGFSILQPAA